MKKHWKYFTYGLLIAVFFSLIILIIGYRLDDVILLEDKGAFWYYWKLPEKLFWPRFTAWSFYALHQLSAFWLIYKMQFGNKKYLQKYRKYLALSTIFFIALHIVQTHVFYDGLAQDVPVMTSQGSVIIMLVLILIMDNKRRGLFFGKKINKLPGIANIDDVINAIRKYHGYFISFAIIYTFWYHPVIAGFAHFGGFLYAFLIMIQMVLMYTPVHTNRYWMFALETVVLVHGTMVAITQNNNMWPMFLFGFATIVVVTQIYGLKLKKRTIIIIQMIYILGVIVVYGGFTNHKTIVEIHQVIWIPIIEYLLVFVFIYIIAFIIRKIKR